MTETEGGGKNHEIDQNTGQNFGTYADGRYYRADPEGSD